MALIISARIAKALKFANAERRSKSCLGGKL